MLDLPDALQNSLRACRTLPSVPAVVLEVLELCHDDDVGIPRVAKTLARDPALSAKVLKVANSAWYGVRSQITTVDRAVALLGINATLSLALSFSFIRGFHKHAQAGFDYQSYWRRSATVAVAARVIGAKLAASHPDELFLAGLLQDIGMLALNECVPQIYDPVIAEAKGDHSKLVEVEHRVLGTDHAVVGSWMLQHWNFPENLRLAVTGSHDSSIGAGSHCDAFVRSVSLASRVAEIWSNPDTGSATANAREASITLLGTPADRLDKMLGEIAAALPEVTSRLDIDIGGEETVYRLLDEAREALVELNLQAQKQAQEFQRKSFKDRLTSLYNRAYLDEVLPRYFDTAIKQAQPLSVIFLDLDHFKIVNDRYGHQAGDQVLMEVALILRRMLRTPDVGVRYGGEEFLCLLPGTPEADAALVGERLRAAVASRSYPVAKGLEIPVTISVGCATMSSRRQFPEAGDLVSAADRCLYVAKGAGRNRVVSLHTLPVPEAVA